MGFVVSLVHQFALCLSSGVQNPAFIFVGSVRDVQALARHSSLQMTQKYIEISEGAMKRVVS
jgi:site-specific recombinase XerD